MRVSKMVRWMGLASGIVLAAACADAPTAAPTAVTAPGDLAFAKGGKGKVIVDSKMFTVVPGKSLTVTFGNFTLDMPANALCAPNQGYGREYWNLPCALEKNTVSITAKWTVEDGAGSIEFNREVRFNPAVEVTLAVKATRDWKNTDAILWLEGTGSKARWVDEGTYDPDMKTYSTGRGGALLWRRLKHFSGYNINPYCDVTLDPSCGDGDAPLPGF